MLVSFDACSVMKCGLSSVVGGPGTVVGARDETQRGVVAGERLNSARLRATRAENTRTKTAKLIITSKRQ